MLELPTFDILVAVRVAAETPEGAERIVDDAMKAAISLGEGVVSFDRVSEATLD